MYIKKTYTCILIDLLDIIRTSIFLARLLQVSEECNILRLNLSEAQHECDQAKQERTALHVKVGSLEETIKVSNSYQR